MVGEEHPGAKKGGGKMIILLCDERLIGECDSYEMGGVDCRWAARAPWVKEVVTGETAWVCTHRQKLMAELRKRVAELEDEEKILAEPEDEKRQMTIEEAREEEEAR
jgi:hypothetical protein